MVYEYTSLFGDLSLSLTSVRVSIISPLVFNYILIGPLLFFYPFTLFFPIFSLKLPPNISLMLFYISCPFLAFYSSANYLSLLLISLINLISSYSEYPESPVNPSFEILLGLFFLVSKTWLIGYKGKLVVRSMCMKIVCFINYNNYNKLLKFI